MGAKFNFSKNHFELKSLIKKLDPNSTGSIPRSYILVAFTRSDYKEGKAAPAPVKKEETKGKEFYFNELHNNMNYRKCILNCGDKKYIGDEEKKCKKIKNGEEKNKCMKAIGNCYNKCLIGL